MVLPTPPPVTPRLPLPYGMSIETWSGQLAEGFPNDWIPKLTDPEAWRQWAADFASSPTFQQYHVPDPYAFKDWQEWAASLVLVMPFAP